MLFGEEIEPRQGKHKKSKFARAVSEQDRATFEAGAEGDCLGYVLARISEKLDDLSFVKDLKSNTKWCKNKRQ